jgi:hypothetical protein
MFVFVGFSDTILLFYYYAADDIIICPTYWLTLFRRNMPPVAAADATPARRLPFRYSLPTMTRRHQPRHFEMRYCLMIRFAATPPVIELH